jgi:hypothetical protein
MEKLEIAKMASIQKHSGSVCKEPSLSHSAGSFEDFHPTI